MINFYKEGEIGKAAFEDGSIYTPQDNVTLNYDATTNGIIISEDEKQIYWVKADSELQVDGVTITGTGAEKLALIAPVFQNAAGSGNGGGGTSARFAYPGEDETSSVAREMNLGTHSMSVYSGDLNGEYGQVYINDISAMLYAQNADQDHFSKACATRDFLELETHFGATTTGLRLNENGLVITQNIRNANGNPAQARNNTFIFPNTAQPDGVEVIHTIATIPTQQFANNADAVAALGVGKLYISTTSLNGSPYILITV